MINSFRQYLVEEAKVVYFTYGRMNPPTIGHGKLLDAMASKARGNPYKVYLSQSQDAKKNPLTFQQKIKHVRKMFPKHARQIVANNKIKTAFDALVDLYNQGYTKIVMIVGSDRVREFDVLFNKYNGQKARHGFYNFQKIDVVSAGERDPDSEGVEGMSASKQRENAAKNDFISFSQGVPRGMSDANTKRLFNDVRSGMNLKESTFKNHIQLETVSKERELYVHGDLFEEGDYCIVKETSELATVKVLGSNYIIIEAQDGKTYRKWLTDVEPLDLEEGVMTPQWLHKLTMQPKLKKMVRGYLNWRKKNPGQGREGVFKAIKLMGLPPRDGNLLINKLNDMIKNGQMPKHLAIAEEYKYEWGTDASTKHAKKMTPGQNEGLWDNIHAKRRRGERMRKKGEKGAPTPDQIKRAQGEATTPQDKDIADRKGTQPARYHTGLAKSTKAARDAQFKRQAKMSDKDPSAYRPAPGDKESKTKPSRHTKAFKAMFGEQMSQADLQTRQDKEAQRLAVKHDRQDDILRLKKARMKNRETDPRVKPDPTYKRK